MNSSKQTFIKVLTPEEGRERFDRAARDWLGMSGEDFLAAWDSGEFAQIEHQRRVLRVAEMIPFARPVPCE